jgi:hypothetical protein
MPNKKTEPPFSTYAIIFLFIGVVTIWTQTLYHVIETAETFRGRNPWKNWEFESMNLCERTRLLDLIREPSNAYSDFSYLFVGLTIVAFGIYDFYFAEVTSKTSHIILYPSFSISFGIHNILHAMGTFWFHSCLCKIGGRMDASIMNSVSKIFLKFIQSFISHILLSSFANSESFKCKKRKFNSFFVFVFVHIDHVFLHFDQRSF